jgi:formylglycine-generating enzyme required for sulfatase activity
VAVTLRHHPETLSLFLDELAKRSEGRILLFLDQFEETFTLAPTSDDAVAFCECLASAAVTTEAWRIVLTLRDDFLGRLAEAPTMRPHLGAVMRLAPLSPADLRAAVLGPLENAGYSPDSLELVGRIVDDVAGQPASLPLFTCYSLWERRDVATRRILTSEYDAMGGATGALAAHAQRFLEELTAEQVRLARTVLLALVNPDGTRRPRLRTELLDGLPPAADAVVDRLLERRLVVATRDTEHDIARIEVAHEAISTAWPQLARWLDETYEERLLVAELEQASALWSRRGKRDEETWGGGALADAVRKVEQWNVSLPSTSRAFLEASIRRENRSRRRRRLVVGTVFGGIAAVTISVVYAALAFARNERELRLAEENMGAFELRLEPFDWDVEQQRPVTPSTRPRLDWQLYFVDPDTPERPGAPYGPKDLRRGLRKWSESSVSESVEARSGAAFLEVSERGGDCPPSLIRLQRLPGYRDQLLNGPSTMHIRVPTCQASRAGMLEIPAGAFYRNRDRDPKLGPEDELVTLEAFWIDRTEVTRAAFDMYDAMGALTGDGSARMGPTRPEERLLPAVGISHATASAYCRYMGKELPSVEQWQKAFRGGVEIDGKPNPDPRRHTTWLQPTSEQPANLSVHEQHDAPAPVGSFPDDTSPYGVVDMAGNVSEWTRTRAAVGGLDGLRIVLGSNWNTPRDRMHHLITWRNTRHDRYLDFVIGLRCVSSESDPLSR